MPLAAAQDRLRELLEEKWAAGAAAAATNAAADRPRRVTRRVDLVGVDEVPPTER